MEAEEDNFNNEEAERNSDPSGGSAAKAVFKDPLCQQIPASLVPLEPNLEDAEVLLVENENQFRHWTRLSHLLAQQHDV
ncbi:hypothetical protein PoB_006363500 [Plakobranchus ocellatus]|uniref:Uncharacterized protein n=1 Tax=Plakobranchus ocellatus TaxID=259542 RepID=A0AAV4CZ92_9GAST|nr:hypothetical protein PoB_006363500 [Plakobranchus ocellatus]